MTTASSALFGNIVSSLGVFLVTAGLVGTWVNQRVSPIEARIDAVDRRLDSIEQKLSPILTLEAEQTSMQKDIDSKLNTELFRTSREGLIKQIDDDKTNVTRVVEELSHQIHRLEEQIVIRAENKQHWDIEQTDKEDSNKRIADLALEIDKRITELTAQINALRIPLGSGSPR